MNCRQCGNEVQPEEVFCGQCGTATNSSGPPPNMMNSVPSGSEDVTGLYKNTSHVPQQIRTLHPQIPSAQTPPYPQTRKLLSPPGSLFASSHPTQRTPGAQQGSVDVKQHPQPHKQHSSAIVLIVSLCIIIVLVSIIAITTFFLRGIASNGSASQTSAVQPTFEPTATPTPQDTPTPTVVPTPLPDAGFTWCGPTCTNYGFSVEYPVGWQLGGTPTNNGIQFTNPVQPDQTATFKTLGSTSVSASGLLNSELQANFMTKSGYVPPQGTGVTTLGGGTWLATTVYYQSTDGSNSSVNQQPQSTNGSNPSVNQRREHVAIYTIVYQSKGYVIEIQAPDPDGQQFTLIYNTYYAAMLSKFSFV